MRGAARIEVWDTGLGIPPEHERAVFAEFRRLDQGARVARGLGLGLSIVERLGRVLEHPVGLRSRPGKGSVFSVTAPLGRAAPQGRARSPARPSRSRRASRSSGLKVLAIDNEPRVLEGMRVLLERWGCAVATAHGLDEASAALAEFGEPDVIIADYHLDSGDGVAAIRALRERFGRSIPAILATADRSPEVRDAAAREDVGRDEQAAQARAVTGAAHPLQRDARGGGVGGRARPGRAQRKSKPAATKSKPGATKTKSRATKSKCLFRPRTEGFQWVTAEPSGRSPPSERRASSLG